MDHRRQERKLYQYLVARMLTGISLTPISQYNLPDFNSPGLYVSGSSLWLFDSSTQKLLRFNLTGTARRLRFH